MAISAIPRLVPSDRERYQVRLLLALSWPRCYRTFLILPYGTIKKWLYSLDPKEAMLVSCEPKFQRLLKYKQEQTWSSRAYDWFMRRIYGISF